MDNQLLTFLLPTLDYTIHSGLQLIFATVFMLAVVCVPMAVARSARAGRWQRNLTRLDAEDGAPLAYGSADELSTAVATPAERWADMLPGLLLVFGLLGTFIGLGLALVEAAGALAPGQDALNSLTPIMNSLGSKFKTSTWGILAFLVLKVWFMLKPYEEVRHAWAASELKQITGRLAELQRLERDKERTQMIDAIAQSGSTVAAEQRTAAQRAEQQHAQSLAVLQELLLSNERGLQAAQAGSALQLQALERIVERLDASQQGQQALLSPIEVIAGHAKVQSEQALLQNTRLGELAEHTQASRAAMEGFVRSVSENISEMAVAAKSMSVAAQLAGNASTELGSVIEEFRNTMSSVLASLRTELKATIDDMGATFTTNMTTMAADLSTATTQIERVIGELSNGVTTTLNTLHTMGEDTRKRQESAQATFAASGDALNGKVHAMTEFVSAMQESIEKGLNAISTSNTRMMQYAKRFEASDERAANLVDKVGELVVAVKDSSASLDRNATLGDELRQLLALVERQVKVQDTAAASQQQQAQAMEQMCVEFHAVADAVAKLLVASPAADALGSTTFHLPNAEMDLVAMMPPLEHGTSHSATKAA
ncbi:hypothetical protein O3301_10895 [Janthinobacterium sp. SUN211]|uniref:hypothetical protein n=1 Tax=Janthinobacterium sp. SUN211 TaxID=3014786 RepID=UPI002713BFB5|nr:hypothetical protein [Janthinobacterium sp. SUN211]MDO8048970.1 hypothetical protein [Janthinobacterium sp. SUN211]